MAKSRFTEMKGGRWVRSCVFAFVVMILVLSLLLLQSQRAVGGFHSITPIHHSKEMKEQFSAIGAMNMVMKNKKLNAWQNGLDEEYSSVSSSAVIEVSKTRESIDTLSANKTFTVNTDLEDSKNTSHGDDGNHTNAHAVDHSIFHTQSISDIKTSGDGEDNQTIAATTSVVVQSHDDDHVGNDSGDNKLINQDEHIQPNTKPETVEGTASVNTSYINVPKNNTTALENDMTNGTSLVALPTETLDLKAQMAAIEELTGRFKSEHETEVIVNGKKVLRSLKVDVYTDKVTGMEIDNTVSIQTFDPKLRTVELISQSAVSVKNSELKINSTRLTACQPVRWHIVARDKDNNLVTEGGESFYAELRGPAIILPLIRYTGDGIYSIEFTPFTPGKYQLQLRHDFSRFSGTSHGCQTLDKSGMFNHFKIDIEQIKVELGDASDCAEALAKAPLRGEWRKLSRKNDSVQVLDPAAESAWEVGWPDFAAAALRTGWVEFMDGEWDLYLTKKMNKKQAQCAWKREQPMKALWVYTPYDYSKYWFYPRPALMGKWIHVLGDSLDEGYLFDILTYALKQQYSEIPVTADVTLPGWDWSDQHPLRIFHFKKLRFTMTFQKLTRPRIDGFHFYEDPQEYAGREWPGSAGIHNMWQEALKVLPVGHQPRPTLAVFHFALHSLSRGLSPGLYELTLRKLVYWWKSNQEYGDVPLVWRGSSVTHFHDREDYLHQKHRCLTRYRLLERDRIAKTVMRETNTPVLDMWSVTDGRPSASWDRRHFSDRGDCYGTKVERSMVSVLLSHLCIMSSRKIGGLS